MARLSRHLDQKLIKTAQQLILEKGVGKLNVRELCELAEVNLGMFHYHFGSKEEFCRIALQAFYEEHFSTLAGEITPERSPLESLRSILCTLGAMARDYGAFFMALLADFKTGEKLVMEFVKKNSLRHPVLIRDLILDCQKRQLVIDYPVEQLMMFIAGAVASPGFLISLADSLDDKPMAQALHDKVLSDRAIKQRVDMALKGVSL